MRLIIFLILLLNEIYLITSREDINRCYDRERRPKKCVPDFINAAFNKRFEATNTCGNPPIEYCVHNSLNSYVDKGNQKCYICDANDRQNSHGVEFLADYEKASKTPTWWQSETMEQGINYPNSVNLTINLGKAFEITYVRITFQSPVPESFVILKRREQGGDWIPYQYYSASCQRTYNLPILETITTDHEDLAICTHEFSDIIPLSGSTIAFSTLEGRPNGQYFDVYPKLQEWVIATDIRIALNRLNSFGDEFVAGDQAKNAYFYAISDVAIGGRCQCNGHAGQCVADDGINYRCICEHNTHGVDCEKCLPSHNDVAWKAATYNEGFECLPCKCNGYSNQCVYNDELFRTTGHGGFCTNCTGNRAGAHCEECKVGFYRGEDSDECLDCRCDPTGSESLQCDPSGSCKCKPGVAGQKCDQCAANYYDLTETGCKQCSCHQPGSAHTPPICSKTDGACRCKSNVESKNCDKCRPGYFNLQESNLYGCFQCFCYGHSSDCTSSTNYKLAQIASSSLKDTNWRLSNANLRLVHDKETDTFTVKNDKNIGVNEVVYLVLPNEYLGNRRLSFNGDLRVDLKLTNDHDSFRNSRIKDLVIENSHENLEVYAPIIPSSSNSLQTYSFRLNHLFNWHPRQTVESFQRLLSNITAIKIRVNYNYNVEDAQLSNIVLQDAKLIDNLNIDNDQIATHIEQCKCPDGYTGQFCDQCKAGFKRENPSLGLFSRCIPCTCNNHSETCDQFTGKCYCNHHTTGDNCEQCESGYYGQALSGTPNDCKKCPCPNDGPCSEIYNYHDEKNNVVCLNCPIGTQGNLCESCEDGYFMKNAAKSECEPCGCNDNIDTNAIGNCDRSNGQCLRCIYNTTGTQCEKCLPGYWGDALTDLKCHACECFSAGTVENENLNENLDDIQCDLNNGQCSCKPNVIGRQCNECEVGFWNITSGNGCMDCKCDMLGSVNSSCDIANGQCFCKPGVAGLKCDQCMPSYYGLSDSGCKKCMCDMLGSVNANCDQLGRCKCKKNIVGDKCDKCDENKYDFRSGCLDCDDCYNLVQRRSRNITNKISLIETTLDTLSSTSSDESTSLVKQLIEKMDALKGLANELHKKTYQDNELAATYNETLQNFDNEIKTIGLPLLMAADKLLAQFKEQARVANDVYLKATSLIDQARQNLNRIKEDLNAENENLKRFQNDEYYTNAAHKNEKLTELAQDARKRAQLKEKIVSDLSNAITNSLTGTKKSIEELEDLHRRIRNGLTMSQKVDVTSLKSKIDQLVAESRTTKENLDSKIKNINDLSAQLKEFKLNDKYVNDIESLSKYIESSKQQQMGLKKELDRIAAQINQYVDVDVAMPTKQANIKYNEVKRRFDEMERYKNILTAEKANCETRVKKLSEMYDNATNILDTLKNFDEKIAMSKEKAQSAESSKPETQENIEKARVLSKYIQDNIHSQYFNEPHPTDVNSEKFEKTKTNANQFLSKAKNTEEYSNRIQERVNALPSASDMDTSSKNLVERYDSYNRKASNITNNAQNVLHEANSALVKANEISASISKYSIENISLREIEELKVKFKSVSDLIDATLSTDNENMEKLVKHNEDVNKKISETEQTIVVLENQVKELEKLDQTLIRNCYKDNKGPIGEAKNSLF